MALYTIPRDGTRPLQFEGTLLARSSGNRQHVSRWYTIAVYHTRTQKYIVHWDYQTQWQGEEERSAAADYATLDAVGSALEQFDPCAWLIAYRPLIARSPDRAELYQGRQDQVEGALRASYAGQVRDLCAALDITEEI